MLTAPLAFSPLSLSPHHSPLLFSPYPNLPLFTSPLPFPPHPTLPSIISSLLTSLQFPPLFLMTSPPLPFTPRLNFQPFWESGLSSYWCGAKNAGSHTAGNGAYFTPCLLSRTLFSFLHSIPLHLAITCDTVVYLNSLLLSLTILIIFCFVFFFLSQLSCSPCTCGFWASKCQTTDNTSLQARAIP